MVQPHEDALGAARRQRVVQGGCKVEQHHGDAKHHRAHHGSGVAVVGGYNQERNRGQRRQQGRAVAHSVGNFFTHGLVAVSHDPIVRLCLRLALIDHKEEMLWMPPCLRARKQDC